MNSIFQVLTLSWSLSGGMLPGMTASVGYADAQLTGPIYYAEYGFELSYPVFSGLKTDQSGLYLGTQFRNEFEHAKDQSGMASLQDTYTISGGLRWNELTIGFEHTCTHSVETFDYSQIVSTKLFGDMDKLFVKLSGKI